MTGKVVGLGFKIISKLDSYFSMILQLSFWKISVLWSTRRSRGTTVKFGTPQSYTAMLVRNHIITKWTLLKWESFDWGKCLKGAVKYS